MSIVMVSGYFRAFGMWDRTLSMTSSNRLNDEVLTKIWESLFCKTKIVFFIVLDCGKIINLSNGGSEEIKMTSYTQGKTCTWLVKVNITEVGA